ncbi:MAG: hypothetical protein CMJ26_01190 [Phycisphaerae bacterium]|nr:hypothetical protein [Phycisphaerae bacterium]
MSQIVSSNLHSTFATAFITLCLSSSICTSPASASDVLDMNHPSYFSFKKEQPLTYDTTKFVVHIEDNTFWKNNAINPENIAPLGLHNWYFITLPRNAQHLEGVLSIVKNFSKKQNISFASPVFYDAFGNPLIPTPTILLQCNEQTSITETNEMLQAFDVQPTTEQAWEALPNSYILVSNSKNGTEVLTQANELAQLSSVRFAEPDMIFAGYGHGLPNDPGFAHCWGLHNTLESGGTEDMDMDSLEAWHVTSGDASVKVLIIDTGVQQDHPDINQDSGADFTNEPGINGGPGNSCDKHGTPVAGCVSAIMNNSIGTVGSAPSANSVSARCFISTTACNGSWNAQYSWTVNALNWGQTQGFRVSNNSNYFGGTSSAIEAAYEATRSAGMVHFASAGNNSSSSISYPASLPTVNSVAALDSYGVLADFSNWGNGLTICAPGDSIYTTDRTGSAGYSSMDYAWMNGTSFSAPYAAGVAALLLSIEPSLTVDEIENTIKTTAIDLGSAGYDTTFGWGFINANNALASIYVALCEGDIDGNSMVNVADLLAIIDQWGLIDSPADVTGDGIVDVSDLLLVVGNWGPCE